MPKLQIIRVPSRWDATTYRVELDGITLGTVAAGATGSFRMGAGEHELQLVIEGSSSLGGVPRKSGRYRLDAGKEEVIRIRAHRPSILGLAKLFITALTIGPVGDAIILDRVAD